ncbi:hypothetical protein THIX_50033 [Thiomonas sp. X19]|nr:hypothetical protein THIX_50015 [Thiomonas sp. X19]SCC93847.1 hypothetical protein THIX_50033 [Thiomonas sp. X19]
MTARHSLFLHSHSSTRSTNSLPLGWLAAQRQRYGLTLFRLHLRSDRTLQLRRRFNIHGGPVFRDHA